MKAISIGRTFSDREKQWLDLIANHLEDLVESWNLDANNCCKNCGYPISIIEKPNKQHVKNRFQLIQC